MQNPTDGEEEEDGKNECIVFLPFFTPITRQLE